MDVLADLKLRRDPHLGRILHAKIVESRKELNRFVMTALISMYGKSNSMRNAHDLFDSIRQPDVVVWTMMISGYTENGEGGAALNMFSQMKSCGCLPDSFAYVAALKACMSLVVKGDARGKELGKEIHSEIGVHLDRYVQCTLIDMYAKCENMVEAHRVFNGITTPNAVCWNTLMFGYVDNKKGFYALELLYRMKACCCVPDSLTYIAALKACTSLAASGGECEKKKWLEQGRKIHLEIPSLSDRYLMNTLINMYGNCGSMVECHQVFDSMQNADVVSWTSLLLGYVENRQELVAMELFSRMKAERRCTPNSVTCLAVIKACTSLAVNGDSKEKADSLKRGREIHSEIGSSDLDHYVQGALIDMYAKCGSMVDARCVFESIGKPNVACWNALLLGYANNGEGLPVIDLLYEMKATSRCAPDPVTYVAALNACGLLGALALGRKLHLEMSEFNPHVVTTLVDFYGQCASMVEAREVFDEHAMQRDVTTWNALLAGYAGLGESDSAFKLFEQMQDQGFRPDNVTFVCMLLCCSHAGLVHKARHYFETIPVQYGINPNVVHYTCMVDVLGRRNQLNESIGTIRRMICKADIVIWMTLLGASYKWKNLEIGRTAFQALMDMDRKNSSAHLLMARIYGKSCLWEEQKRVLDARLGLIL